LNWPTLFIKFLLSIVAILSMIATFYFLFGEDDLRTEIRSGASIYLSYALGIVLPGVLLSINSGNKALPIT